MALTTGGLATILLNGLDDLQCTIRLFGDSADYPGDPAITKTATFGTVSNSSVSLTDNVIPIPSSLPSGGIYTIIDIIQGTTTSPGSVLYKEDVQLQFANEGSLTFNLTISIPTVTPFVAAGINRMLTNGISAKEFNCRFFSGINTVGSTVTAVYSNTPTVDAQAGTAKISLDQPTASVSVTSPPITVDNLRVNFVGGSAENFINLTTNFSFTEEGTLTVQDLEVVLTN